MRLYEQPAHVLHDMLVNKEITSVELTKDVLARIDEVEGEVKAYLTITRDEALQQAAAVDEKMKRWMPCRSKASTSCLVRTKLLW